MIRLRPRRVVGYPRTLHFTHLGAFGVALKRAVETGRRHQVRQTLMGTFRMWSVTEVEA